MKTKDEYFGDGVYASFDGYQIWLRTSDGITVTNSIALEPPVFDALLRYQQGMMRDREEALKFRRRS